MTLSPARRDYDKREDYRLLQRPRKINNNTQSKRERKEKEEKEEEKKEKVRASLSGGGEEYSGVSGTSSMEAVIITGDCMSSM